MNKSNNSPANHVVNACVHELVAQQAARSPAATAVSTAEEALTYGELEERSSRVGEFLRHNGIVCGDLVGISMDRRPDLVAVLLGILKAGAAYVPMDPVLPSERLEYMAADAQPKIILTTKNFREAVSRSAVPSVCIDQIDFASPNIVSDVLPRVSAEDLAYVLYTSGSTGKPKGVEVSHGALTNFLLSMREVPGCRETDVLLSVTTIAFDISGLELYLPLIVGGRVELASSDVSGDGRLLLEHLEQSQPTMMQATPSTWRMLIHAGWGGTSGLVALCGGESLPRDLADQLLDRTAALWNMYGPTETTIWSTLARIKADGGMISIGEPIANTQVYVLDQAMRRVEVGQAGELYIGGAGIARGYHNLPAMTAERFIPDPFSTHAGARLFRTGDLVRSLADGSLVHLGRLDSQVKIRGFRIEPNEIQIVLALYPPVEQVVVSAFDDRHGYKQLVAYIVNRGDDPPNVEEMRKFLRKKLPEYMIPAYFVFLKTFPLTKNKKLDIKALPMPSIETATLRSVQGRPRNRLETQVLAIWRQSLEYDELGVHDSFFDAGGTSIKAAQLLARVEDIIGYRLPLDILLQLPTVAQMVDRISSADWRPVQRSMVVIQRGGSKVPFFAVPGAGGNVLMFALLARRLGPDQPFYGLQARGVDNYEAPFSSINEMASQYVTEIRSIQPTGPYFIGGSCTGGIVAYEMAQQLVALGERVALVILDSEHPSAYRSYVGIGASVWRIGYFWSRAFAYINELRRRPWRTWPTYLSAKAVAATNSMWVRDTVPLEKTELQLRAIYHQNMAAVARYQVRDYPGSLLNVVATGRKMQSGTSDTRHCWDSLALAVSQKALIAAKDSGQLFVSPHVEVLAKLIEDLGASMSKPAR